MKINLFGSTKSTANFRKTTTLRRSLGRVSLIFLMLFLIPPSAWSSTLDTSHVIGRHSAPNGFFKVVLSPDSVQLLTEPSQNFMNAMTKSKAAADWWGSSIKTFDATGSLGGVFTVDVYNPVSPNNALNRGGAELLLRYNRSNSDPDANNLFWIQVVDSNLKNGEETTPYPDVYLSGYHKGKKLPFYYRPDETNLDLNDYYDEDYVGTPDIRSSQYTLRGKEYNYDLAFWGFPKRNTYDYWSGELFLASYDKADELVRIYDGVKWGFNIVPEPPSLLLFFLPALFVFFFLFTLMPKKATENIPCLFEFGIPYVHRI